MKNNSVSGEYVLDNSALNKKDVEILQFIIAEKQCKGYPPSIREICKKVNLASTSSVYNHLVRLEKLNYIRRDPTKPRAIEVLFEQDNSLSEILSDNREFFKISDTSDTYVLVDKDMIPDLCHLPVIDGKNGIKIVSEKQENDILLGAVVAYLRFV